MPADVLTSAETIDRYLGARLRQLRKQHQMSLQTCGDILDVTYQQVQKYETGVNRLSVTSLVHLGRSFGIAPASFFDGLDAASLSGEPNPHVRDISDLSPAFDDKLIRAIARLSPLSRHLLNELVLAIDESQTRRPARNRVPPLINNIP